MKVSIYKILLIMFFLFPLLVNADDTLFPIDDGYVYDEVGVISKDTIDYINYYSTSLYDLKESRFYVFCVEEISPDDMAEYGDYLFEQYNISKNGILVLCSVKNEKVFIKVSDSLSQAFINPDLDNYIVNYFLDYVTTGDWDLGIRNGYSSLYKTAATYLNLDVSDMDVVYKSYFITKYRDFFFIFILAIDLFLVYRIIYYLKLILKKLKNSTSNCLMLSIFLFILFLLLFVSYMLRKDSILILLLVDICIIICSLSVTNAKKTYIKKRIKRRR